MAPPINVQDWYGDRHTCQIASGALGLCHCVKAAAFTFGDCWIALCSESFDDMKTAEFAVNRLTTWNNLTEVPRVSLAGFKSTLKTQLFIDWRCCDLL